MVTATNSAGTSSVTSNLTSAVLAKATSPVNSRLPAISGSATVGQTLHASSRAWTGVAMDGLAFQWNGCNSNGSACSSIAGATGQSYGVSKADVGTALRVNVTATNSNGSTSASSAAARVAASVASFVRFDAALSAGQEVRHPKGTSARAAGHFTAKLTGKTLRWTLTFSHLSDHPTVTNLNKGARGVNGVAFKSLCRNCLTPVHGTLTLTASQRDALMRGRAYVNIHTVRNTSGELRGQVTRVS
jgi:CHRD domain/Ig domain of plant-specific actin-binding protein